MSDVVVNMSRADAKSMVNIPDDNDVDVDLFLTDRRRLSSVGVLRLPASNDKDTGSVLPGCNRRQAMRERIRSCTHPMVKVLIDCKVGLNGAKKKRGKVERPESTTVA